MVDQIARQQGSDTLGSAAGQSMDNDRNFFHSQCLLIHQHRYTPNWLRRAARSFFPS